MRDSEGGGISWLQEHQRMILRIANLRKEGRDCKMDRATVVDANTRIQRQMQRTEKHFVMFPIHFPRSE